MIDYPFSTIFINNREVELIKIISGEAIGQSDFEESTYSFIRSWMTGEKEFYQNTSGSTGAPKTISISREQMESSARLTEEALQLKPGFHALVCLDTRYIAGKMMLVRCFVTGMKIVAVNPSANPLKELPFTQRIDFAAFVPYQVQEIISSGFSSVLNTVQTSIIGGAALDKGTREKLKLFSCQFYGTYGMTETVSHIALQKLNGTNSSEFFQTLSGVEIKLDDRNCLIIKSPHLKNEIHTNDIVEIISAKEFKWIGRYDNVINSGGVKVSPENVELGVEKIFQEAGVNRSFFITGVSDQRLGEKIQLIIEGERLENSTIEKIISMFKHNLSVYSIPKEIVFKRKFFLTETGKINRIKTIEFVENQL